jgi:regulator of cell morphogenesis and NO signaling
MNITSKIGEIVVEDYRTASVFKKYKIDFCCNGGRSLEEACATKKMDATKLLEELQSVNKTATSETIDFNSWDLDLLIDYIEKKHHRYVNENIPVLLQYLDKLCKVHGTQHPELYTIYNEFKECADALTAHMKKEELILFPFIKKMVKHTVLHQTIDSPSFSTVENPIQIMLREHDTEGERFRRIAEVSNDYTPPADACNTYRVAFHLLKAFEEDLHNHIHLENNILFPKAIKMEKNLMIAMS